MIHRERNFITKLTWIISNSFWMLDSRKIGHWKNETKRFKASTKHSMIILSTNTPKNLTNIWKWYSYLNSLLQGNQECAKNWKNTSPFCLKPNFLTFHFFANYFFCSWRAAHAKKNERKNKSLLEKNWL